MSRSALNWGGTWCVLSAVLTLGLAGIPLRDVAVARAQAPAAVASAPGEAASPEFQKAGVCARCHVVSVLEWGISAHVAAEAACQNCHGPSRGHVENERNEVKPDRLPRGDAIAKSVCATCHETGCPTTLQVQACQKCHHVHALLNPAQSPSAKDERLEKLLARWRQFEDRIGRGEERVRQGDWTAAQAEFREALRLIPGHHRARTRLEMCTRRLDPALPGFAIVGEKFDPVTGLPQEVVVAGRDLPMRLVPPGEFDMGADELPDSRPVHTVRVDAFYLARHEVTQGLWQQFMGENPSAHQGPDFPAALQMPVERVSWDDCQEFLRRLNASVPGGGFRLPTEAEWEYACRAGGAGSRQDALRGKAAAALGDHAWFRGNSRRPATPDEPFLQVDAFAPRPVGTKLPNAWGFHDMQGNVSEWCASLFRAYLYDATDGREAPAVVGMRVLRGGGFADSPASLDPALRHAERAPRRLRWNGLRLARSVPPPPG